MSAQVDTYSDGDFNTTYPSRRLWVFLPLNKGMKGTDASNESYIRHLGAYRLGGRKHDLTLRIALDGIHSKLTVQTFSDKETCVVRPKPLVGMVNG